jgi:hypothetical protein
MLASVTWLTAQSAGLLDGMALWATVRPRSTEQAARAAKAQEPGRGWSRKGCGSSATGTASQRPEVPPHREACGALAARNGRAEGTEGSSGSGDCGRSCRRLAGARIARAIAVCSGTQPRCSFPPGCCVPAGASRCRCSPDRRGASGPPGDERSPGSPGSPGACRRRPVLEFSGAGTRRNSRLQRPGSAVARGGGVAVGTGHGGVHRDGGIRR